MTESINVCLACDDNYSKYAGVVIASILANANPKDRLNFYILDGGISEDNKQKIQSLKFIKDCEINFITIDESMFEEYKVVPTLQHISFATFYRLKLTTLLPEVDKVIYLDCDMVAVSSLKNLFETDFENNYACGVIDIGKKLLRKNPNYVNAGMLFFNLNLMRKDRVEEKYLDYIKSGQRLRYADQDIINGTMLGRIKIVDEEWNVQSSNFTNRSSYTNNPRIIHFIAKRKPWMWASFSYHRNLFFKYLQLTPWKLSESELNHWIKDNQIASLIEYFKYRPLFLFRPRFYYAFYRTYIKDFLPNIFSIKEYNTTHNLMKILGFKIKYPKKSCLQAMKENPYHKYKKNNIDITTLPPATGQIRDIQLANLALLKELDYVCKQNNLQYWLDGGSQLGAIRHKGYIPWDDDIDVGMLREDYNKIIDAFNKTSRNPDIFADYYRDTTNPAQMIIKVQHRYCKYLFVDIFPFDVYGKSIEVNEQLEKSHYIKEKLIPRIKKNSNFNISDNDIRLMNEKIMKTEILTNDIPTDRTQTDLIWGIDFQHSWNNWFTNYNVIFPLKPVEFEGFEIPCINDSKAYLSRLYGDYMRYPKKITCGHSAYVKLTTKDKEIIEKLKETIVNR